MRILPKKRDRDSVHLEPTGIEPRATGSTLAFKLT